MPVFFLQFYDWVSLSDIEYMPMFAYYYYTLVIVTPGDLTSDRYQIIRFQYPTGEAPRNLLTRIKDVPAGALPVDSVC